METRDPRGSKEDPSLSSNFQSALGFQKTRKTVFHASGESKASVITVKIFSPGRAGTSTSSWSPIRCLRKIASSCVKPCALSNHSASDQGGSPWPGKKKTTPRGGRAEDRQVALQTSRGTRLREPEGLFLPFFFEGVWCRAGEGPWQVFKAEFVHQQNAEHWSWGILRQRSLGRRWGAWIVVDPDNQRFLLRPSVRGRPALVGEAVCVNPFGTPSGQLSLVLKPSYCPLCLDSSRAFRRVLGICRLAHPAASLNRARATEKPGHGAYPPRNATRAFRKRNREKKKKRWLEKLAFCRVIITALGGLTAEC